MFKNSFNFEIDTLFRDARQQHGRSDVVLSSCVDTFDYPTPITSCSRHPSVKGEQSKVLSNRDQTRTTPCEAVTVYGAHNDDLPTVYTVNGLAPNELPVIGTYVDKYILPGFKYRVRQLGKSRFLFEARAMTLQSIGRGYGKRITFNGDSLNHNSNYFYSDTEAKGYGFSPVSTEIGDSFIVKDNNGHTVADVIIKDVLTDREASSQILEDGSIQKKMFVVFCCIVDYSGEQHGLMPLYSQQELELEGQAVVVKEKNAPRACTRYIEQIELPHCGQVIFEA